MSVTFCVEGSKAYVQCGGHRKEIPRDSMLEIYQLTLGHVSPNRDYSNITSIRKLKRTLELECEPDESEESSSESPEQAAAPTPAKKAAAEKKPGRAAARKQPAKKTSESKEDSAESS